MIKICPGILLLFMCFPAFAQQNATVKEYRKTFTTYPFSNPNPVPDPGSIFYPYFRFDGYTDIPVKKEWKVVELENDFIKVLIMPEIGGKIWTAIDKKNNKPFIYNNDAVKFRDIAMRGPWTSGGLEANFGIIGHTPGVATPVNYLTFTGNDGSATCVISLLDLLTQTRWNMEITLPKDKGYFITRFFWHNGTSVQQPYYQWMNLGQKVTDSLEYIFPGNHYLFHDGKVYDWPYNPENHKNISVYDQNNFGSYKSYHVTGTYSKYFGVLWQKENYGMIHYAERQDKIGKKIWIWGLSRQGMIWEKLLTDHAGQYTEIQSGRLYNQNAPESVETPFKQFDFAPYSTDSWAEYWYPYQHTGGVANADLNGVLNMYNDQGKTKIYFSSVSYIKDTMKLWNAGHQVIASVLVNLQPLQSFEYALSPAEAGEIAAVSVAGSSFHINDTAAKQLDRPVEPYPGFDWNTAYGCYLKGSYASGTRRYAEAEKNIGEALALDASFVPALSEMAFLQYRKLNYDSAFQYARRALSVDTYDPKANYYYGLSAQKLGKVFDARDGFEVAAITPAYRAAAYTELAKIQLHEKNYKEAAALAGRSLVANTGNIAALQLLYLCDAAAGDNEAAGKVRDHILKLDPINHFMRFETYWQNRSEENKLLFTTLLRDELPEQTYLDLALWYEDLGLEDRSKAVLEICPQKNDEIRYWLTWLHRKEKDADRYLSEADSGNAAFVFPYREESIGVMKWALQKSGNWKSRYYLALLLACHDQNQQALQVLLQGEGPQQFAPYYVFRSRLREAGDAAGAEQDLLTAFRMDKNDWRYAAYLSAFLQKQQRFQEALAIIAPSYKKDPANYLAGLAYARLLLLNKDFAGAEKVLAHIHILPNEGAKDAHKYYEQAKLMLALEALQKKQYKKALQKAGEAKLWPENLGAGAPYPDMADYSLEEELASLVARVQKGEKLSDTTFSLFAEKIMKEASAD